MKHICETFTETDTQGTYACTVVEMQLNTYAKTKQKKKYPSFWQHF